MGRRAFKQRRIWDDTPYVTRSDAHDVLDDALVNFDNNPVLLCGIKEGFGVTRTLEEFGDLLKTTRYPDNIDREFVIVDFAVTGQKPVPEILCDIRNQLMEKANAADFKKAHEYFKVFDVILDGWFQFTYRNNPSKPALIKSKRQLQLQKGLKILPKAAVALIPGWSFATETIGSMLVELAQEGVEELSEKTLNMLGEKIGKWLIKELSENHYRGAVATMNQPIDEVTLEGLSLLYFIEAIVELQAKLSSRIKFLFVFDALDENDESSNQIQSQIRGAICQVVQDSVALPNTIAFGSRGEPLNWVEDLRNIALEKVTLGFLEQNFVENAWKAQKLPEKRIKSVLAEVFADKKKVSPLELSEAWARSK